MEYENIFRYKDQYIYVRIDKEMYQLGVGKEPFIIWLDKARYNSVEEIETSGVEYAKIVIDKMKHNKLKRILF